MRAGDRLLAARLDWILESSLTSREKIVLVMLAVRDGRHGIAPSLATIAADTGLSRSTLCRVLTDLENKMLITREQRRQPDSAYATTLYRLHFDDARKAIGT